MLSQVLKKLRTLSSIHKGYLERHLERFSTEIGHSSLALDVGSGDTPYRHLFDSQKYIAIDLNTLGNVKVVGDICALPFHTGTMDVVICTEVIEHVQDVDKALEEVNRVLRKGRYLVLTTPLLIGEHDAVDYHRFTEAMLKILFEEHGFGVLQIEKRGGILSALGAILLQVPLQILGVYESETHSRYKHLLIALIYVFLVPLTKCLVVLDILDKAKRFTLGYDCLCIKIV